MTVNELIKVLEFTRDIEQMGEAPVHIEIENAHGELEVLKKISFARSYKDNIFFICSGVTFDDT